MRKFLDLFWFPFLPLEKKFSYRVNVLKKMMIVLDERAQKLYELYQKETIESKKNLYLTLMVRLKTYQTNLEPYIKHWEEMQSDIFTNMTAEEFYAEMEKLENKINEKIETLQPQN